MTKPWVPLAVSFATLAIIGVFATRHCMQKGRKHREAVAQREQATARLRAKQKSRLDVAAFREDLARRRAKAQALAARPIPKYTPPPSRGTINDTLHTPECILGPGDLCTSLTELIAACDGKDAPSCLAIGQFLQDTPPRPMVAIAFLHQACELGESSACERKKEIMEPPTKPCSEDPFRCAWYGRKANDLVVLDDACIEGVADACAFLALEHDDEPELEQRYIVESCQLGNPMACAALGERLSPGCTHDCYPPDPDQAAAAKAIGCAAGFEVACK